MNPALFRFPVLTFSRHLILCEVRFFSFAAGCDDKFTLMVWDWQGKTKVAEMPTGSDKIFSLVCSNNDPSLLVAVGEKTLEFFGWDGRALAKRRCTFGQFPSQTFVNATFSLKGFCLAGAKDGSVYLFMPNEQEKGSQYCRMVYPNLCDGPVLTLCPWPGGLLVAGGKDGKIIVLDSKMKPAGNGIIDLGV